MTHNKSTTPASSLFQNSTHDDKVDISGDLSCLEITLFRNNLECTRGGGEAGVALRYVLGKRVYPAPLKKPFLKKKP